MRRLYIIVVFLIFSLWLSAQPGIYSEMDVEIQNKFMEAQVHKYLGETDKQIDVLKKLLKLDRDCHAAMYELSKVYSLLEDTELAINYASKAYQADSNEWYAILLADAYEAEQYFDKSSSIFSDLIAKDPYNLSFYHRLAFAQQIQGHGLEAVQTFNKLEEIEGVTENTSKKKFEIYSNLNMENEAAGELEKLVSVYPSNMRFLNNLASYYSRIGKDNKANETYQKVLIYDPSNSTANMAMVEEDFENAKDDQYLHAIKPLIENSSIPLDAKIKELIPYVMDMNEDGEDPTNVALISNVDRLVSLYPNEAKVHALHGDVYYKLGDDKKALKAYQKALSLNNNIFSIWINLMAILYESKSFDQLGTYAEEAIDMFPNQFDAYFFKGMALLENGNLSDFEDLLFEAGFVSGKVNANLLKLNAMKAALSLNKNKPKEALQFLSNLETDDVELPYAYEIFGDTYAANNDMKMAMKFWKRSFFAGNSSSGLKEKINQKKLIE